MQAENAVDPHAPRSQTLAPLPATAPEPTRCCARRPSRRCTPRPVAPRRQREYAAITSPTGKKSRPARGCRPATSAPPARLDPASLDLRDLPREAGDDEGGIARPEVVEGARAHDIEAIGADTGRRRGPGRPWRRRRDSPGAAASPREGFSSGGRGLLLARAADDEAWRQLLGAQGLGEVDGAAGVDTQRSAGSRHEAATEDAAAR